MRRAALSLALLACLAAAGGCATYVYDRAYDADYYHRRADDDVARYVSLLDRELDLSRDQERRVERLLASRTRHLLDHTRAYEYRRVYPFPREHRSYSRARRDWWRDADRHIGRVLSRRQADRYYDLIREGRLYDDYDRDGDRRGRHSR